MSKVILKNVKKKYPNQDTYSVKDFNMEINEGELVVLVGPSGCGKSTTLRMIAGLEDISEGELIIDDKVVNDVKSKDRDIAMVFQSYALYPHMTVRENIGYGLKLRKFNKNDIKEKVDIAADQLGLEEFLDRKPKDMSGGQRQRVALGRAIVRTPKMYLMDEPLSNLDAKLRAVTRAEISKIHREKGAITIYVTHDQTEAMTMADKIVVMESGDIKQIGTPRELYNNPIDVFVATFIGQPSMNIVEGKFDGERFVSSMFNIKLADSDIEILRAEGYEGKTIKIGVRQHHVHDQQIYKDTYADAVFSVTPTNVEYLGDHISVFFEVDKGNYFTAKLGPNSNCSIDKEHEFVIETTKLYFFDAETNKSIMFESNKTNDRQY